MLNFLSKLRTPGGLIFRYKFEPNNILYFRTEGASKFVGPDLIQPMFGQMITKIETKSVHITLFTSCRPYIYAVQTLKKGKVHST